MLSDIFSSMSRFYRFKYMSVGLVYRLTDKLISIRRQSFDPELERGIRRRCLLIQRGMNIIRCAELNRRAMCGSENSINFILFDIESLLKRENQNR